MDVYIYIYILAAALCFVRGKKLSTSFCVCFLFFLALVCLLRGEFIGSDTKTYLKLYRSDLASERYNNEFLFYYITYFARFIGVNEYGCQVIVGAVFYIPFSLLIVSKSRWPALSVLIFIISTNRYFFESFNISRQIAAVGIVLWGFSFLYKRQLFIGLLILLLACGFHMSALLCIPIAIFCYYRNFSIPIILIILIISLVWAFMLSSANSLAVLLSYMTFLDYVGLGKYIYLEGYRPEMERTMYGLIALLVPHVFLCIILLKNARNDLIAKIYFCGVVLLNIVAVFPISYRFALCLTSLDMLIIPSLLIDMAKGGMIRSKNSTSLIKVKNPREKLLMIGFVIVLYIYSIWSFCSDSVQEEYVPYETFF